MTWTPAIAIVSAALLAGAAYSQPSTAPSDSQISHIAYTAGQIDATAAEQALDKSKNSQVRAFAQVMVRDHRAVNDQALALVKKLGVTPQDNPTSAALKTQAKAKLAQLARLDGAAYDRAYVQNEVDFHATVNSALKDTLIPNAQNAELKDLLRTGLQLFTEHERHAEHLAHELPGARQ